MSISNCKRCGRIFNRVRRDICPACVADEDKLFIKIREYLRKNRSAFIQDVVDATGIDMEVLIEMIQDGRIILSDNPNMGYGCERCGGFTQSGRLCARCSAELAGNLTNASDKLKARANHDKGRQGGYYSK